jgi:hypothetical protein
MRTLLRSIQGLLVGTALSLGMICAAGGPADAQSITVDVTISPSTIVLGAPGEWITAHTDIPYSSVDRSTVALNGIAVAVTKADACGDLVAKFRRPEIEAIVAPPEAILLLTGVTKQGEPFAGEDTVVVVERGVSQQRQKRNHEAAGWPEEFPTSEGDAPVTDTPGGAPPYGPDISEPSHVALGSTSPNPLTTWTAISYSLGEPARVDLSIYDSTGRLVETVLSGYQGAGSHVAEWDAHGASPGVYFYRLQAGDHAVQNRCVVLP